MAEDSKPVAVGDVVRLKSGGPAMTVEYIGATTRVVWWWDGQMQQREVAHAALRQHTVHGDT